MTKEKLYKAVWELIEIEASPDNMSEEDYIELLEDIRDRAQDKLDGLDINHALSDKGK